MAENSSDNLPRPEMSRPTGHVVGDNFIRLFFGLVSLGISAFGIWMWTMYTTQQELRAASEQVAFKLDLLNAQLAEAKNGAAEAMSGVRDCERRLDRIEATRFTEADAAKTIAPLEHRIERLESTRRR